MSKIRIKPSVPVLKSRQEAEVAMNTLASKIAEKQSQCAEMDRQILAVKEKFQADITALDTGILQASQQLEVWATANPSEFPKDAKSLAMLAGTIGFRKDTPSLVPLNKTFTWGKIMATIAAKRWRRFIRVKPEVDKAAILARSGTLEKPTKFQRTMLPLLGLKIAQEEKFFIEPDLTKVQQPEAK